MSLFFLYFIMRRTRNALRQTFIYFFVAIFIMFIRRILNLLNLSAVYNTEILDDVFAIIVASFLLISAITLFRDIHRITDIEVNKTRGGLPPRQRPSPSYHERYRHEPPQKFRQEKREPIKPTVGLSAGDLVKRK